MGNFYTEVIVRERRFASQSRIADPALLEPVTRLAVAAILTEAQAEGLSLLVFETYRSQARQGQLFAQGATQLRRVGVHHYGLAADIVKIVRGEPSWDGDFGFLGRLARKHGLIWGGDWTFRDFCHVQRCAVADQQRLFNGVWYPNQDYNPYGSPSPQPSPTRGEGDEPIIFRLASPLMRGGGIRQLQYRLRDLGYLFSKADDIYGPNTTEAVRQAQKGLRLPVTGQVDEAFLQALGVKL